MPTQYLVVVSNHVIMSDYHDDVMTATCGNHSSLMNEQ